MKYEKIIFIYPFSIGSFLNAKVGLEATIEEGDNYIDCFHRLRKDVKEMASIEQGNIYDAPPMSAYLQDEVGKVALPKDFLKTSEIKFAKPSPPEPEQKPLMQLIQESKTPTELKGWNLLIKAEKEQEKKRELLLAYDAKMRELQKQPA